MLGPLGMQAAKGECPMSSFEMLLSPGKIGNVELKNRLVVPAMVANMCPDPHTATEQYVKYHEEKAKGGWGLIITEDYLINPHAGGYPHIAGIYTDEQVESHKAVPEACHKYGAKVFAQLYHAGRQATSDVNGGVLPMSCSPIPDPWNNSLVHELTVDEIHGLVDDFAKAAANAKRAGFDGVEIHAAHGYLIHEFTSPNCNKRTDEYGGNYENRMRFLKEVMEAVREATGPDFAIQVRLSSQEETCGGRTSLESHRMWRDIERWGADSLHVSNSMYGTRGSHGIVGSYYQERGYGARFAAEAKQVVDIPVVAVASIHDPYMAEEILEAGEADFIGMARMSLTDPHLPNKLRDEDSVQNIRPCVRCLQGCTPSTYQGVPLYCMVNPELGHEWEWDYSPAKVKKKIYIAGGGVAGMEAARAAALKGHDVVLFEASDKLGGQFLTASFPPHKGDFSGYLTWIIRQVQENPGIEIRMNTPLTADVIEADSPDKVIIATGARPVERSVPGLDKNHVIEAQDLLRGRDMAGMFCVVVGGGLIGAETASFLATQCKANVTLTTRQPAFGTTMSPDIMVDLKAELIDNFVDIRTNTTLKEIKDDGVIVECEGREEFIPCDTVVTAFGTSAYDPLSGELEGVCADVEVVGDAKDARLALEAIHEGFRAGLFA